MRGKHAGMGILAMSMVVEMDYKVVARDCKVLAMDCKVLATLD